MTILILLSIAALALALRTGSIGVHSSSVYKDDNPVLYWFQILAVIFVLALAILIRVRGGD